MSDEHEQLKGASSDRLVARSLVQIWCTSVGNSGPLERGFLHHSAPHGSPSVRIRPHLGGPSERPESPSVEGKTGSD